MTGWDSSEVEPGAGELRSSAADRLRGGGFEAAIVCVGLALLVWLVFGQTLRHDFVNYDDDAYVYQNPVVIGGLARGGVPWALTFGGIGHWHPLTWFSHMLDYELFGLWAGGHHLTSVVLHAGAAVLLFLALKELTGSIWRSALVAAVFAIHPQRVESVAWIAERKDVLSGLFFMATMLAYARYVRAAPSRTRYTLVVLLFALGLMSKGMLVTLPFVLLLLDYWPLKRLHFDEIGSLAQPETRARVWRLMAEKIPLFVLSAGSCVMTLLSPEKVAAAEQLPLLARLANAVVSYVVYLKQMIYPAGLTLPYFDPPGGFTIWQVIGALALLIAISAIALASSRKHPYLLVGWLWYVGMMLPVVGLVQISYYARADRYTYLPQIGLYLIVIWGAADLLGRWRAARYVAPITALLLLVALIPRAHAQAALWRNSHTLWSHALKLNPSNHVAHNNLGLVLGSNGDLDTALTHFRRALEIRPTYVEAINNIGTTLSRMGRMREAAVEYEKAVELRPDLPEMQNNLATALAQSGRVRESIPHFRKAVELAPQFAGAHANLGNALLRLGQVHDALPHLRRGVELSPNPDARQLDALAAACAETGDFAAAVQTASRAMDEARATGDAPLASEIEQRLSRYRERQPAGNR